MILKKQGLETFNPSRLSWYQIDNKFTFYETTTKPFLIHSHLHNKAFNQFTVTLLAILHRLHLELEHLQGDVIISFHLTKDRITKYKFIDIDSATKNEMK